MTSADLIAELQAARPTADTALRQRVATIATARPERRQPHLAWLRGLSLRRFALVAVPATLVVLLGIAGGAGLLHPGSQPRMATVVRESVGQTTTPMASAPSAQLKAGTA